MKHQVYNFILLWIFVLIVSNTSAQTPVTFSNSEKLPDEISSFMGVKSTQNKEMKEDVQKFCEKLTKRQISDDQKAEIVTLLNDYAAKRAKPTPHMQNLIKAFNAFWESGKTDQFLSWADYVDQLIKRKDMAVVRINDVTLFTANLFGNNSIEQTSSKSWYFSSNNFKLQIVPNDNGEKKILVKCDNTDLRCKMRQDSTLAIYKTSGTYDFEEHKWSGRGGKVDWRRGDLSPDSVYAELSDYIIETKSAEYEANNVTFYNKKYFRTPIKGNYRDKLVLGGTGAKARFPQFTSSSTDIKIPNLAEGIDYVGGYSQSGVLFHGFMNDSIEGAEQSKLIIKRNGKPFIEAKANSIVFGSKKLEAQQAGIAIILNDTAKIEHPGVKFKYDSETQQLILFKSNTGMENAKYLDNYHKLEIDVNQIEWKRGDSILYFCTRPAANVNYATFESQRYYSSERYNSLRVSNQMHPLVMLRDYNKEKNNSASQNEFTIKKVQTFASNEAQIGFTEVQIHQMLMKLSYEGFIDYDTKAREGVIKEKTYDYLKYHAGKLDYDEIQIVSKIENRNGINAIINLKNNDLMIYNALSFDLSKKRMVKVLPDSVVVVHNSLNMDLRGKIQAGLIDVYGNDFKFDYSNFQIKIPKSDSLAMLTLAYNENTKKTKIDSIRSVFEKIVGTITIDEKNNHSGVKENNYLPSIKTTDTSYVYYDRLISENYDRNRFYMQVFPFKLDSLNFMKLEDVEAKGKFVSGIFPDLKVTLTAQKDLSLGFVLPTPKEGMPLFGGKGTYHNVITLNGKGLGGNGEINYLTALARSDDFMFYPDSVTGGCNLVKIDPVAKSQIASVKGVKEEYPDVYSDTCQIMWLPHSDKFSSITNDTTLYVYKKEYKFNGTITLSPVGMDANGKMLYSNTGVMSEKFTLKNRDFRADSALFANFDPQTPGDSLGFFYTDRYDAYYNLDSKKAQFTVSLDTARVHFPKHKYKQKTDFFEWDFEKNAYSFGKSIFNYDEKLIAHNDDEYAKLKSQKTTKKPLRSGIMMISDKDSLRYSALYSSFVNTENIIKVNEPGEIPIIDAKIDPSGVININQGGDISRFENAVITANRDTLIHKIINTTVKIRDKYYFKAVGGQYEYQDYSKGKAYLNLDSMEIRRIKLDTAANAPRQRVSFGIGNVPESQHFMISPQFMFVGKYSFMGVTPGIKFNGFSYIQQNCDSTIRPFKFEGNINPDSILFPISERVMDTEKARLSNGFFYNEETNQVYSLLMGKKLSPTDKDILTVNRGLTFEPQSNQFRVATPRRLRDTSNNGNYLVLYNGLCNIYAEGDINTNVDIAPVQLVTKGELYHDRDAKKITGGMLLSLNFPIRQDVMKAMAENINDVVNLDPVYLTDSKIRKRMEFLVGNDTVANILENYTLTGELGKLPNNFNKTIILNDVKIFYDTTTGSYRSKGEIGVAFIGGIPVNKYMKGNVEILHSKKKGDQITVYIHANDHRWYYFNYQAGFMYCLSSVDEFNQKITNTKEKDRTTKIDKIEYQYVIGADENKNRFVRSFRNVSDEDTESDINNVNDINQDISNENQGNNSDNNGGENVTPAANANNNATPGNNSDDEDDFELEDDNAPSNSPAPSNNQNDDDEPDYIDE